MRMVSIGLRVGFMVSLPFVLMLTQQAGALEQLRVTASGHIVKLQFGAKIETRTVVHEVEARCNADEIYIERIEVAWAIPHLFRSDISPLPKRQNIYQATGPPAKGAGAVKIKEAVYTSDDQVLVYVRVPDAFSKQPSSRTRNGKVVHPREFPNEKLMYCNAQVSITFPTQAFPGGKRIERLIGAYGAVLPEGGRQGRGAHTTVVWNGNVWWTATVPVPPGGGNYTGRIELDIERRGKAIQKTRPFAVTVVP